MFNIIFLDNELRATLNYFMSAIFIWQIFKYVLWKQFSSKTTPGRRARYVLIRKESKDFTSFWGSNVYQISQIGRIASFHTDNCTLGVFLGTLQNAFNFGTLVRLTHLSWRVFLSMKKS